MIVGVLKETNSLGQVTRLISVLMVYDWKLTSDMIGLPQVSISTVLYVYEASYCFDG